MSETTDIFQKCIPAYRTNIDHCGLMTVCDAVVPKPSELDAIFQDGEGNWRVMDAMFLYQMEMNACQAVQSGLFKYLMASVKRKNLPSEIINSGLSHIRPFIQVKRKNPINNNYWKVSGGAASLANGTLDAEGTYWRVDVQSGTGIPIDTRWFNTLERAFISGQTEGGTSTHTAYKVHSATIVGAIVRLVLLPQNSGSFLDSSRLENPVTGLLERGTANIDDYESFCSRPPGIIPDTLDEFWIETTRDATCEDELYNKWRDLVMANNPLYAKFFDLDTIAYNKQTMEDFQMRLMTQFFRGVALPNQTRETVNDLEQIESVEPGGARCIGRRANAIGIYEQHVQCDRVVDLQGAKLNIPALAEALYGMMRIRKSLGAKGDSAKIFEVGMPSQFFPAWNLAMLKYYEAQAGGTGNKIQYWVDLSKEQKVSPLGFVYQDYKLVWPNVTLRIFTDDYFDDYLAATLDAGMTSGRQFWIVNWSEIYMGVFKSERVTNVTNDRKTLAATDPTYACVMKIPSKTYTLTSLTWTAICECTAGNLILENFSGDVPEVTDQGSVHYPAQTTTTSTSSTSSTTTAA